MASNFMRFSLGKGELYFANLFLSFLFAKISFALMYFFLKNSSPTNESIIVVIARSTELFVFLALVATNFSPNRFPISSLLRTKHTSSRIGVVKHAIALIIFVAISRYIIELIVVMLAVVVDPNIILKDTLPAVLKEFNVASIIDIICENRNLPSITISPVVEEIIYRAVILNFLLARFRISAALILSSLAFAALHGNPITAFLCGLVLGHIYIFTKNIWMCVLAHSIMNLTIILLKNFGRHVYPTFRYDANLNVPSSWIYVICTITWFIWLMFLTFKYRKNSSPSPFTRVKA